MKHGASSYRGGRCHDGPNGTACDTCRTDNQERSTRERASRFARLKADPSIRPHGRSTTYTNWGCRCSDCCAAWSDYLRRWETTRRIFESLQ